MKVRDKKFNEVILVFECESGYLHDLHNIYTPNEFELATKRQQITQSYILLGKQYIPYLPKLVAKHNLNTKTSTGEFFTPVICFDDDEYKSILNDYKEYAVRLQPAKYRIKHVILQLKDIFTYKTYLDATVFNQLKGFIFTSNSTPENIQFRISIDKMTQKIIDKCKTRYNRLLDINFEN